MGNEIKKYKFVDIAILSASLLLFIGLGYPMAKGMLSHYNIDYYRWQPKKPVAVLTDTRRLSPAKAVPILMYHGVMEQTEEANTSIDNFIAQMTMLKENGYQTISIADYDRFRGGHFVLPPKPIIITFDDGRKDSYYTTDDIFRQLGFKATVFVATEKAREKESFYLSFDELRKMRDTGRWEIEAHGRRSHEKVPIGPGGIGEEYGRFLTSRMWLSKEHRLETAAEFERRVEADYVNNINDLRTELNLDPEYIAIPLNDYGQQPVSNNPQAAAFNQQIVKKYFRMAFIEANSADRVTRLVLPVYNYKNDNPYLLRRIEVKNMAAADLKAILEREHPTNPELDLRTADSGAFLAAAKLAYGYVTANARDGLRLRTLSSSAAAKLSFGDSYWDNYGVTAVIDRRAGRSVALLFYSRDDRNYYSFGLADSGLFLRSRVNGRDIDIRPPVLLPKTELPGVHTYRVSLSGGRVTAYFDGQPVFANVPVETTEGAAGLKIWGGGQIGEAYLKSFSVTRAAAKQS